jgi:hypothetical protein
MDVVGAHSPEADREPRLRARKAIYSHDSMLWTDLLEGLVQHQRLKQIHLQQIGLNGLG